MLKDVKETVDDLGSSLKNLITNSVQEVKLNAEIFTNNKFTELEIKLFKEVSALREKANKFLTDDEIQSAIILKIDENHLNVVSSHFKGIEDMHVRVHNTEKGIHKLEAEVELVNQRMLKNVQPIESEEQK